MSLYTTFTRSLWNKKDGYAEKTSNVKETHAGFVRVSSHKQRKIQPYNTTSLSAHCINTAGESTLPYRVTNSRLLHFEIALIIY